MKKILIAIDDSSDSDNIASAGLEFCKQLNPTIALISVADISFVITDGVATSEEVADMVKAGLKKNHEMLIDKHFPEHTVSTFIEVGKPDEMILKVADEWEADLIILGTHGRTGLSHILLGSVAEKVIRHSTRPLLVIPNKINSNEAD